MYLRKTPCFAREGKVFMKRGYPILCINYTYDPTLLFLPSTKLCPFNIFYNS